MQLPTTISEETPYALSVIRPHQLPSQLSGTIARLEGNFKPHLGKLPNGKLVLYVAHSHGEANNASTNLCPGARSLSSHAVQYISPDGGQNWDRGRHIRELMSGHEPSVSIEGSRILVMSHVHGSGWYPDPYAERDHVYLQLA